MSGGRQYLDPEMCSGRWSFCDGSNPRRSATWALCEDCTEERTRLRREGVEAPPPPVETAEFKRPRPTVADRRAMAEFVSRAEWEVMRREDAVEAARRPIDVAAGLTSAERTRLGMLAVPVVRRTG